MFCSLHSNQDPAIVYGQRDNRFEITAGSCRGQLLHSEWKGKFAYKKKTKLCNLKWKKEKKLWLLLLEQQKNDRSSLFFSSKLAGLL